jgi:hypothetical protein
MLLVLGIWWAWRWACVPASAVGSGLAVAAGFFHDAMVLYGFFGLLRWWHGRAGEQRQALAPALIATSLLAASAMARALDALQVRLTDTHLTRDLLAVMTNDPLAELWGLRGLLLAVLLSTAAGFWALRQDLKFWCRLRSLGVGEGFRVEIFAGASLVAGVALAWGRAGDPPSVAPEIACGQALLAWVVGG